MIIGNIEGNDVIYSASEDMVYCKNIAVPAEKLIEGYEGGYDRYSLATNLVLRRNPFEVTMGCFKLTHDTSKQLIRNIKNGRTKKR